MDIPQTLEGRAQRVLNALNKKLLEADPRLAQIATTLSGATRVAAGDRDGGVDLRLVPLKPWDLLARSLSEYSSKFWRGLGGVWKMRI